MNIEIGPFPAAKERSFKRRLVLYNKIAAKYRYGRSAKGLPALVFLRALKGQEGRGKRVKSSPTIINKFFHIDIYLKIFEQKMKVFRNMPAELRDLDASIFQHLTNSYKNLPGPGPPSIQFFAGTSRSKRSDIDVSVVSRPLVLFTKHFHWNKGANGDLRGAIGATAGEQFFSIYKKKSSGVYAAPSEKESSPVHQRGESGFNKVFGDVSSGMKALYAAIFRHSSGSYNKLPQPASSLIQCFSGKTRHRWTNIHSSTLSEPFLSFIKHIYWNELAGRRFQRGGGPPTGEQLSPLYINNFQKGNFRRVYAAQSDEAGHPASQPGESSVNNVFIFRNDRPSQRINKIISRLLCGAIGLGTDAGRIEVCERAARSLPELWNGWGNSDIIQYPGSALKNIEKSVMPERFGLYVELKNRLAMKRPSPSHSSDRPGFVTTLKSFQTISLVEREKNKPDISWPKAMKRDKYGKVGGLQASQSSMQSNVGEKRYPSSLSVLSGINRAVRVSYEYPHHGDKSGMSHVAYSDKEKAPLRLSRNSDVPSPPIPVLQSLPANEDNWNYTFPVCQPAGIQFLPFSRFFQTSHPAFPFNETSSRKGKTIYRALQKGTDYKNLSPPLDNRAGKRVDKKENREDLKVINSSAAVHDGVEKRENRSADIESYGERGFGKRAAFIGSPSPGRSGEEGTSLPGVSLHYRLLSEAELAPAIIKKASALSEWVNKRAMFHTSTMRPVALLPRNRESDFNISDQRLLASGPFGYSLNRDSFESHSSAPLLSYDNLTSPLYGDELNEKAVFSRRLSYRRMERDFPPIDFVGKQTRLPPGEQVQDRGVNELEKNTVFATGSVNESNIPLPAEGRINVGRLADQVYREIEKRISIEKDRRGLI